MGQAGSVCSITYPAIRQEYKLLAITCDRSVVLAGILEGAKSCEYDVVMLILGQKKWYSSSTFIKRCLQKLITSKIKKELCMLGRWTITTRTHYEILLLLLTTTITTNISQQGILWAASLLCIQQRRKEYICNSLQGIPHTSTHFL